MLEHTQKEYETFEKNRFEAINEEAENKYVEELEKTLKVFKNKKD